jgi:phosphonate transport system substrate-binding protein
MSRWVANGEVDIVQDSFFPAMLVASNSGAVPLVIRNKDKSDRHAVFFARADSGLTSLEDLKGRTIALAESHSTSGFMLPINHLKQLGINPTEQPSQEAAAVAAGDIGYIFSGDDDVAAQWVLNQTVIAGAVDNGTFEDFDEGNPGVLIALDETEGMTRNSMILARKDLDPALQENIRQVLLAMDQNPVGMATLEENGTVNFIQFQGESELVWARAQEMYQLIQD